MTISKRFLTPVAFVALLALSAVPARAGQHRGESGHGSGRSRESSRGAQAHSYPGYRGGVPVRGAVVVGGGGYYGAHSYYRPYYSFRPRVSLGFGIWMGYPVAYPYYYASPYQAAPYSAPYAYEVAPSQGYPAPYGSPNQPSAYPSNQPSSGYPPYGSSRQGYPVQQAGPAVGIQRGGEESESGGVSFEITPSNATVFVDGTYMGTAGSFGATAQPLGLRAGRHHVEIRASGYRTMAFDADVEPAQVIPYQGTLQRN